MKNKKQNKQGKQDEPQICSCGHEKEDHEDISLFSNKEKGKCKIADCTCKQFAWKKGLVSFEKGK